jgi:hypothetical protein
LIYVNFCLDSARSVSPAACRLSVKITGASGTALGVDGLLESGGPVHRLRPIIVSLDFEVQCADAKPRRFRQGEVNDHPAPPATPCFGDNVDQDKRA